MARSFEDIPVDGDHVGSPVIRRVLGGEFPFVSRSESPMTAAHDQRRPALGASLPVTEVDLGQLRRRLDVPVEREDSPPALSEVEAGAAPRAQTAPGPIESLTPGRCVYCEGRCEANAFWHEYCREDSEREQRALAMREPGPGKRV